MHGRKGSPCGQGIHLGRSTRTPNLTELPNQVVLALHPNDPWPHGCMQAQTGKPATIEHQTCPGLGWKGGEERPWLVPAAWEGVERHSPTPPVHSTRGAGVQEMCGSCSGCFDLVF